MFCNNFRCRIVLSACHPFRLTGAKVETFQLPTKQSVSIFTKISLLLMYINQCVHTRHYRNIYFALPLTIYKGSKTLHFPPFCAFPHSTRRFFADKSTSFPYKFADDDRHLHPKTPSCLHISSLTNRITFIRHYLF